MVKNDVKVGDHVVIARGAPATGEITQQKRTFGKMQLRMLTVTAIDGRMHSIRALSAKSGKNPERPVDTGAKKPDRVEAAAGTDYVAYANGDMSINVRGN